MLFELVTGEFLFQGHASVQAVAVSLGEGGSGNEAERASAGTGGHSFGWPLTPEKSELLNRMATGGPPGGADSRSCGRSFPLSMIRSVFECTLRTVPSMRTLFPEKAVV